MKRTPILVCGDAGVAGRILLARKDIDVRWAITVREAQALLDVGFPQACIVSEDLAAEFLALTRDRLEPPPSIVLLDNASWMWCDAYFDRGATAIVHAGSGERILQAISELTGISFAVCPRVPYETVLDVQADAGRYFVDSADISASGVSIRDMNAAHVGMGMDITFVMMDPPLTVRGLVVRESRDDAGQVSGVCFTEISDEDRKRVIALVEGERSRLPPIQEPIGFTADLAGPMTLDVSEAVERDERAEAIYRVMLSEVMNKQATPAPSWLGRVAEELTSVERAAVLGPDAPFWVNRAIEHRIALRRARHDIIDEKSRDAVFENVIEFCCSIAKECDDGDDELALSVTKIRADLFREIFGAPSRRRIGAENRVAKAAMIMQPEKKKRAIGRLKHVASAR